MYGCLGSSQPAWAGITCWRTALVGLGTPASDTKAVPSCEASQELRVGHVCCARWRYRLPNSGRPAWRLVRCPGNSGVHEMLDGTARVCVYQAL